MFEAISSWLAAHPVVRGALWMLLIALIGALYNWVTYARTEDEWKAFVAAHPRQAAVIRVMRIIFPHLRKFFPAIAPFLPPDPPANGGGPYRSAPPTPPNGGGMARLGMKLGVAGVVALSLVMGCSWFKPAKTGEPPPAQAVVLYTAKTLIMLNTECARAADAQRIRAKMDADPASRIVTLKKADALAAECDRITVAGRAALEAVELLFETGNAIADKKVGCAVKNGLDAASDACTAMRVARVIEHCPHYVDTAITFGSPLLAAVGACPLKDPK